MVKTLKSMDIKGKCVIIRCDFNVPIKNGKILDDTRIIASLKTIKYCLDNNCKIILISHLGRIKTKDDLKENSLKPVATILSKYLHKRVKFINETHGKVLDDAVKNMKNASLILMENTRFEDLDGKKESNCDDDLSKYWASLGDIFINDAFATIHRNHASVVGIAKYIPCCAGFLVEEELNILKELENPEKPYTLILGGKKVNDKIGVLKTLLPKVDYLLLGGGMANTFLKAEGFDVASSFIDNESLDFCKKMLKKYEGKIVLPVDVRTNTEYKNIGNIKNRDITDIKSDEMILDIGSKTAKIYKNILKETKTVFWNGPLGVYEFSNFSKTTEDILKFLTNKKIKTILGGGDIVASANILGYKDKVYFASTGGGATLKLLENHKLEGIKVLEGEESE